MTVLLGLKLKYTSNNHQNITYLDEGFIDLTILKIVEVPDLDLGKKSVNLNLVIFFFLWPRAQNRAAKVQLYCEDD